MRDSRKERVSNLRRVAVHQRNVAVVPVPRRNVAVAPVHRRNLAVAPAVLAVSPNLPRTDLGSKQGI